MRPCSLPTVCFCVIHLESTAGDSELPPSFLIDALAHHWNVCISCARVASYGVKSMGLHSSFEILWSSGLVACNSELRHSGGFLWCSFPILMMVWKIAPALACGNTIVIKVGSSQLGNIPPVWTMRIGRCRLITELFYRNAWLADRRADTTERPADRAAGTGGRHSSRRPQCHPRCI